MPEDGTDIRDRPVLVADISESTATLQTARRLKADVVERLYRSGTLDSVQRTAACEIREVWMALSRGLFAASRFGSQSPVIARGRRSFRQPFDRLSDRQRRLFETRYRMWNVEVSRTKVGGCRTLAGLVHEIVIDNRGPRQIDRAWRLRNGSARDHLCDALDLYASYAFASEKMN